MMPETLNTPTSCDKTSRQISAVTMISKLNDR